MLNKKITQTLTALLFRKIVSFCYNSTQFSLQNREKLCQKHRLQKMLMVHQVLKS